MKIQNFGLTKCINNCNQKNLTERNCTFYHRYEELANKKMSEANSIVFSHEEFREIIEDQKKELLEDEYDWWTERMLRHKMFMQLRLTGEIDGRLLMDLKNNSASSYVLSLFSPQLSQEELEEKERIEKLLEAKAEE